MPALSKLGAAKGKEGWLDRGRHCHLAVARKAPTQDIYLCGSHPGHSLGSFGESLKQTNKKTEMNKLCLCLVSQCVRVRVGGGQLGNGNQASRLISTGAKTVVQLN